MNFYRHSLYRAAKLLGIDPRRAKEISNSLEISSQDFANERSERSGERDFILCFANEVTGGEWVMLAPYGDFPNSQGLQRVTRADADTLARDYAHRLTTPQYRMGVAVYKGHPDHQNFQARDTDTRAVGRVKALQARPDGLFANVVWNEEGKRLVMGDAPAFSHVSVNWPMRKGWDGAWHPVGIKSVGLTNSPNLPIPAILANEGKAAMENPKTLREMFLKQVAELMSKDRKLKYQDAWNRARNTSKVLFEEMEKQDGDPVIIGDGPAKASAAPVMANEINRWMVARGSDYATAYIGVKRALETGDRTQLMVNDRMLRGEDYVSAYKTVANELPAKSEIIEDGQKLLPNTWPVPGTVLQEMGLSLAATQEQYRMYLAADEGAEQLTPAIAAFVLRTIIQSGQLSSGQNFDAAYAFVQQHFPDLFAAAKQWQP